MGDPKDAPGGEPTPGLRPRSPTEELAEEFRPRLRLSTARTEQARAAVRKAAAHAAAGLGRLPDLVRRLPRVVKLGVAGGVAVVVVVVLIVTAARAPATRYVTASTKLRSGPSESGFPEVARLEKGEPLAVLEVVEAEHWLLVKDSSQQVGYVLDYDLATEPPAVQPDEPFTRCLRRRSEPAVDACLARARAQREACDRFCSAKPQSPFCPQGCASRETDCARDCGLEPVAHEPVAAPSAPAEAGVATPAAVEPTAEPVAPPAPRKRATETKKTKHRRGRH